MKTHYEHRMDADLAEIESRVRRAAARVQEQLDNVLAALFDLDRARASDVVLGDWEVNRRVREIDRLCHAFIVRYAPSEEYLRRVSSVLRLGVALERVGDYGRSVGREVARITEPLPDAVAPEVSSLADRASWVLEEALAAYLDRDEARARERHGLREEEIDVAFEGLLAVASAEERSLSDVFRYRHICHLFMRVAEQATNIRELTLFALHGEVSERRAFRVLFVDQRNDRLTPLAEAYARWRFRECGDFVSAGWEPARAMDPAVAAFLEGKGITAPEAGPRRFDRVTSEGEPHHVVVVVGEGGSPETIPFRTTVVRWDLDDDEGTGLERTFSQVTERVDDLMRTLAGPEAA